MDKTPTRRNAYEVDWENPEHLFDYFTTKWNDRYEYMGGRYRRWYETIACYEGFYYYDYDTALRNFQSRLGPDFPEWRSKLLINLALPRVRTLVSRQLKNRPIFDVLPATGDTKDINIASGNKKILQGMWYEENWNYQFIDILYSLALCGQGYLYPHWNPNTGPLYKMTPEEFVDEQVLQSLPPSEEHLTAYLKDVQNQFLKFVKTNGGDEIFLGKVMWGVPSPFNVLFPDTYSFAERPWQIIAQIRPISYYANLGYDIDKMKLATEKDRRFLNFTQRLNTLHRYDSATSFTHVEPDEKGVLELMCWEAPNQKLKRGWHCVMAGGELIANGPNPYNHNELPLIKFSAERTPGKVTSFSPIEQIIPQVREYQKSRNKVIEIRNLMAAPKWLVPNSAKLDEGTIDSEPGECIVYKGPLPPVQVQAPPAPAYIFDMMAMDIRDIDEVTGQHDSTKGVNAPGVRSAAQGIHLAEMDESQLSIQGLDFETGMAIAGRQTLAIIHQYMPGERLIRYVGEKGKYEIVKISPESMVGDNNNLPGADYFCCRVTLSGQYGLSRYGQLAFLDKFLQYGLWGPEDRTDVMKFIGMGQFENEIDKFKIDRSNADKENKILITGQMLHPEQAQMALQMFAQQGADPMQAQQMAMREGLKPSYSDHHPTHLAEHMDFAKTEDFKALPLQIQQMLLMHIQLTEVEVMKMQIKPQVLMMKAQIELLQEQGMPPEMAQLLGANENGGQSSGKPSGRGAANRNTNPGGPRK